MMWLQYFGCWPRSAINSIGKSFKSNWIFISDVWFMSWSLVSFGAGTFGGLVRNRTHQFKLRIDSNVPECWCHFGATISGIPKGFNWWLWNMFLLHGRLYGWYHFRFFSFNSKLFNIFLINVCYYRCSVAYHWLCWQYLNQPKMQHQVPRTVRFRPCPISIKKTSLNRVLLLVFWM